MANDTGKVLKEISNLTSNMDILFQELRESAKNNLEASKELKNLSGSIKEGINSDSVDLNQTFKGFTESFTKSFSDQNDKLLNSLTDKISKSFSGSVSDFLSSVPNQVAQVKSGNIPDFKSILGGNTIKNLVKTTSAKIPGLANGGTIDKTGLAIVGERGPELVELKSGTNVKSDAEDAMVDSLLTSKSGATVRSESPNRNSELETALSTLTKDREDIDGFIKYANSMLDKSDIAELISDGDYLRDELTYYRDQVKGRETFTLEDVNKLSKPVTEGEISKIGQQNNQSATSETNAPTLEQAINPTQVTSENSKEIQLEKKKAELAQKANLNNLSASALESLTQKLYANASPEAKKALDAARAAKAASLSKETTTLKEKQAVATPPSPTPDKSQENKTENAAVLAQKAVQQAKDLQTQMATSKSGGQPQPATNKTSNTPAPSLNERDVKEIKTLLASIYNALKSPLTISNDYPFRPNSNTF